MSLRPSEIVAAIAVGQPTQRRNRAAGELIALLSRLTQRPMPKGPDGLGGRIDEDDREDLVMKVAAKIAERAHDAPLVELDDGQCIGYFTKMLANAWWDVLRVRKRQRDYSAESSFDGAPETPESGEFEVAHGRALLERAFAHVESSRLPRYRDGLRLAWRQIKELVFEDAVMDALLERDEGVSAAADPIDVKHARDRVLQNHKRLRDALDKAFDQLVSVGTLSTEESRLGRASLQMLFRCQRTPRTASPSQEPVS